MNPYEAKSAQTQESPPTSARQMVAKGRLNLINGQRGKLDKTRVRIEPRTLRGTIAAPLMLPTLSSRHCARRRSLSGCALPGRSRALLRIEPVLGVSASASLGFAISHDPPRFRQQRFAVLIVAFVSAPARTEPRPTSIGDKHAAASRTGLLRTVFCSLAHLDTRMRGQRTVSAF